MAFKIPRTAEDDAGGAPLDIAQAIAEFYGDFPEHVQDVFILNHQGFATGKEAVASIEGRIANLQKTFPAAKAGFAKSLALGAFEGKLPCSVNISESLFTQSAEVKIFGRIVIPAGAEFTARVMKSIFVADDPMPNTAFPMMASEHNNTEMWQRYVLDHELGHAVTMISIDRQSGKSSSLGNKAECEADAYAMIRHFQRYGADSTFPAYLSDLRNMNVVHKGDVTHWTSRAIDYVIALNAAGALARLTPQESRDLAVKIAVKTHLSADAEFNISEAFGPTTGIAGDARRRKTSEGEKIMSYIAGVASIGAKTSSPSALEVCRRYMSRVGIYAPAGLPQTKTADDLNKIGKDLKSMRARTLNTEPPMPQFKRALRDALIDAQSGAKKDRRPPGTKFKGPKGP